MSNKDGYTEWVKSKAFMSKKFWLTWIDLELMANSIIRQYNSKSGEDVQDWLINKFINIYTDSQIGGLSYKDSCDTIGLKALVLLKEDRMWQEYTNEYKYIELFNRCIEYDFKNNRNVKDYMRK